MDVAVSLIDGQIETILYVKPTDSHQYLQKSIPYRQALRPNRICSKNTFFDIHCNNLAKWLGEKGHSEKLNSRSQSRETLLHKEKRSRNDDRVTFNITYYHVFKNFRIILDELHILLVPDEQHGKVFTDIPRIGFKNGKSL